MSQEHYFFFFYLNTKNIFNAGNKITTNNPSLREVKIQERINSWSFPENNNNNNSNSDSNSSNAGLFARN